MTSLFGWVDYSERERARMAEVIELFRERDTRDELGIGVIRDAFADLLFPGVNTMQTRARYLLFVPWIYRRLEQAGYRSVDIAKRSRRDEVALIHALLDASESDDVIGRYSQDRLQRMPSNIYWLGMGALGIRRFDGTQDQYHRSIDGWRRRLSQQSRGDDGGVILVSQIDNWDPALPPPPDDFPNGVRFALTRDEAEYLRDKVAIAPSARDTLLRHLVANGADWDGDVEFAWDHPKAKAFPRQVTHRLTHARAFSELIHGAPLLYNLMLAKKRQWDEMTESYSSQLVEWRTMVSTRSKELHAWDQRAFWALLDKRGARVHPRARTFVREWMRLALEAADGRDLSSHEPARRLVEERERQLKGSLARLANQRALENWNGASGAYRLNYRWSIAQAIVRDILQGLEVASDA